MGDEAEKWEENHTACHSKLQVGDFLSTCSHWMYKGQEMHHGQMKAVLVSTNGNVKYSSLDLIDKDYHSHNQVFDDCERKVTKTEMAKIFSTRTHQMVFTVIFTKQLAADDEFEQKIEKYTEFAAINPERTKRRKLLAETIKGEKRTLIGYRISSDDLGRSQVWDLEKNEKRQVDHRTIESLIFGGHKYILKK